MTSQDTVHRTKKFNLIHFTKMHGLGNDFMVIETLTQQVHLTTELIQSWADRHMGIGFDQLLVLSPPDKPDIDFRYQIFNRDGSEVGQCGNGARAIARFITDQKLSPNQRNRLSTQTNTMTVETLDFDLTQVEMDQPVFEPSKIPFNAGFNHIQEHQDTNAASPAKPFTFDDTKYKFNFYAISVGNPHAVIFVDNIHNIDTNIASTLQNHPCFPEGVNVGFAEVVSNEALKLRVFERGAGETQACGSGATAAAVVAIESQRLSVQSVDVQLGHGSLRIDWDGQHLKMTGPAKRVFTGRILAKR